MVCHPFKRPTGGSGSGRTAPPAIGKLGYGIWHAYQYDDYQMFVSPPVNGWVLVMGMPIVWEADSHAVERMVELSKQFDEVQLFASVRTSSSYMWARASKGKLVRLFYEGDGERSGAGAHRGGKGRWALSSLTRRLPNRNNQDIGTEET
jgi:hypothetical protein